MGDDLGGPEFRAAFDRLFDLLFGGKPGACADALADVVDRIPKLTGTEWAARLREARYDGDRLMQVVDEFNRFVETTMKG